MLGHVLSFVTLSAIAATAVTAQTVTPLTDRRYNYPDQIVCCQVAATAASTSLNQFSCLFLSSLTKSTLTPLGVVLNSGMLSATVPLRARAQIASLL
jgi:hypothetical protein